MAEPADDPETKPAKPQARHSETLDGGDGHPGEQHPLGASSLFEIESELAQGGMGRVMRAHDLRLGRVVALKLLRHHDRDQVARFEREAALTARLQHPGIVPVYEAGQLSNGEPFYAMPLVSGKPLDEMIRQTTSLGERIALLPNLIDVADALAYAHDQRIIHRDLKPQNVIVGRFGETLVIDWGLAKDLDRPTVDEPSPISDDGEHVTQAGTVLGTPAYMAPEQARGEPIDERGDVYALGAMLCHTLTGKAPHLATSSSAVIRERSSGTPTPIDQLAPEVPIDLQAIVKKAMAEDAVERYRNAGELASDLRRFQAGQLVGAHRYSTTQRLTRFLRRHRTAALLGAALLPLLGVAIAIAGRQRQRANTQHAMAEKRGVAAEGLVDFLVDKLYHRLYDLGRLDLLDGVGESVAHYYDLASDDANAASARSRASALEVMGAVAQKKGDEEGALRMLASSLAIRTQLAQRFPDKAEWPLGMASLLHTLSVTHQRKGELDAALRDSEAAIEALNQPAVVTSKNVNRTHQLVYAWLQLGELHRAKGDAAPTLEAFRSGMKVAQAAVKEHPDSPRETEDLAMIEDSVGDQLQERGELDQAGALFGDAVASVEKLLKARPDSVDYQNSLTFSLWHVAMIAYERGDFRAMRDASQRSVAVARHLASLDPDGADQEDALDSARINLASAAQSLGDYPSALHESEGSARDLESLVAKHPESGQYLDDFGVALSRAGSCEREAGDLRRARRSLERATTLYIDKLVPKDPANVEWRESAWEALARLAEVDFAAGRPTDALERLHQAKGLLDQLARKDPDKKQYLLFDSLLEGQLGLTQAALGNRPASLEALRLALDRARQLAAADPTAQRFFWQKRLAEAAYQLERADPAGEARPILVRQIATLKRLRAENRIDAVTVAALPKWESAAR